MVQDMVSRIREAERQGEELERQATAQANARLAQVGEEIAALHKQAEEAAAQQRAADEKNIAAECEQLRVKAEAEAAGACEELSRKANERRDAAIQAAAALLSK